jgi:hypothetical protein
MVDFARNVLQLLGLGDLTTAEMVDASFAMAMAAATPGPLGGGCWALRYCVDYPAFGGSILRGNAGPKLLSGDTHRRHISWMARGHLYYGGGNS